MACRDLRTPADLNNGTIDLDLLPPDMRGENGEDDPADHRDDAWTRHGIARASRFTDSDHMAALLGPNRYD